MKSTYNKHRHVTDHDLNLVAEELDALARRRLPDHILGGDLTGKEADIRQDAVLMAYHWYLCHKDHPTGKDGWNADRAISATLKIQKRDALKESEGQHEAISALAESNACSTPHATQLGKQDWPLTMLQILVSKAIRQALRNGAISQTNAAIAMRVLVDQLSVAELARQLGVHRSNIYQHINRVRKHLPDIIDGIEINYRELI